MDILTVSSLYPNQVMPNFGVFVETRLRRLVAADRVRARVVAPVPWFPVASRRFGEYGAWATVARHELRHGIKVNHPRYLLLPKIGMRWHAWAYYYCLRREVVRLRNDGVAIDLIDAHYFYPDGVAAVRLGRELGIPVTVTARGSDLNQYPQEFPAIGRMIRQAALAADGLITVCQALKDVLVDMGIDDSRVTVLRNGVDLELFQPTVRPATRSTVTELLSVGYLIERKGHHLVIEALAHLPDCRLTIVGDGPERHQLENLAAQLGVADRVIFAGSLPHEQLPTYYNAADILVLASSREGWANVLLEAMACGTPVVATRIWGTPEVITAPAAGRLVDERTAPALVDGIRELLANYPERTATRGYAEGFAWEPTTHGQQQLFHQLIRDEDAMSEQIRPCPAIS